jgi:DnaJ-class molecular chaperone
MEVIDIKYIFSVCYKCDGSGYLHQDWQTKKCDVCNGKGETKQIIKPSDESHEK